MENHYYHTRWPPLNFTIFITHAMGATPKDVGAIVMICLVRNVILPLYRQKKDLKITCYIIMLAQQTGKF